MILLRLFILNSALAHFIFLELPWQLGIYITKPLTMVLVIALCLLAFRGPHNRRYARLVLAALLFSLLGDVLLMLDELFLPGLLAFFVAQIFYVAAFWTDTRVYKGDLLAGIVILLVSGCIFIYLQPYLESALIIPVAGYMLVISVMVWRAVGTSSRPMFQPRQVQLIVAGAILFYISDLVLAINRFAWNVPWSSLIIMVTYFAAQYLLASSVYRLEPGLRTALSEITHVISKKEYTEFCQCTPFRVFMRCTYNSGCTSRRVAKPFSRSSSVGI